LPPELGLSLPDERGDALFRVVGRVQHRSRRLLRLQAGGERGVAALAQQCLGHRNRDRRRGRDPAGQDLCGLEGAGRFPRPGSQTPRHGLRPGNAPAAHDQLGGADRVDQAGQPLRVPAAGQQPELGPRQAELRIVLHDDEVTAEREFQATAEGAPVHRSDDRLRAVGQVLLHGIAGAHEVLVVEHAQPQVVLDVRPGREGPAVAVQDGDPRLRRGGQPGEVLVEEAEGVRSQRVELGRPVQGDEGDAAGFAVPDIIVSVGHAIPDSSADRSQRDRDPPAWPPGPPALRRRRGPTQHSSCLASLNELTFSFIGITSRLTKQGQASCPAETVSTASLPGPAPPTLAPRMRRAGARTSRPEPGGQAVDSAQVTG
jgi:hypothetical protein